MNNYWISRLAEFRQAPIVDLYGVVSEPPISSSRFGEANLHLSSFSLVTWRVGDDELQATPLRVIVLVPVSEIGQLSRELYRAVHFKARMAVHMSGSMEALYVELVELTEHDEELKAANRYLTESVTLDLSPLPPLHYLRPRGWYSETYLSSWLDFYPQSYPDHQNIFGGFSFSSQAAPLRRFDEVAPPTPAQIAAYQYLVENDERVRDAVLQAMFEQYPQWQQDYGADKELMPDVTHPMQFKSLVKLWSVSIGSKEMDGFAEVNLGLLPNWDIEHGMGAILIKDHVIAIGDYESLESLEEKQDVDE